MSELNEATRQLLFEMYCRAHQTISIAQLAQTLGLAPDHAERWIVNMIREARLDAKIDSANNLVVMGVRSLSVYDKVIQKTKGLSFRSLCLLNNIERAGQLDTDGVKLAPPRAKGKKNSAKNQKQ